MTPVSFYISSPCPACGYHLVLSTMSKWRRDGSIIWDGPPLDDVADHMKGHLGADGDD